MDFVRSHWYIFAGLAVLLLYMTQRSGSSGATVQQIGGAQDPTALQAEIDQNQLASDAQKLGFVSSLLQLDFATKQQAIDDANTKLQIAANTDIAKTNAQYNANIANSQYNAQQYSANLQYQQALAAMNAQQQALQRQQHSQNLNTILGRRLFGLGGQILPGVLGNVFGNSSNDPFGGFGGIGIGGGGWGGLGNWGGGWGLLI
jgi:hypothetical protein